MSEETGGVTVKKLRPRWYDVVSMKRCRCRECERCARRLQAAMDKRHRRLLARLGK